MPGNPEVFVGRLRDLSRSGAGLQLEAVVAQVLLVGSGCRVALDLDPDDEALQLGGLVRQMRSAEDDEIVVGVEFDPTAAGRPENAQRIYRWVTERQLDQREDAAEAASEA